MSTNRAAVLVVSAPMLASLLQLPDGAEVDAVWVNVDQPGVVRMRVRGAGWPTVPGDRLRPTIGTASRDELGRVSVDWGFPKGD